MSCQILLSDTHVKFFCLIADCGFTWNLKKKNVRSTLIRVEPSSAYDGRSTLIRVEPS